MHPCEDRRKHPPPYFACTSNSRRFNDSHFGLSEEKYPVFPLFTVTALHSTYYAFSNSNICTQPAYALRYIQSRIASESLAASTTTLFKMSEYFNNYDFDALMGPADQVFDFSFLDNSNPSQVEVAGYDFDPSMDFAVNPAFDFDFNAGFQPDPLLPVLPSATMVTNQS
ncbi:hypothetical protein F4679DRAFT_577806 [Xylaria curta]|nr:hypothetical protein F4679DRAFT_577806 [Xylaria curta]